MKSWWKRVGACACACGVAIAWQAAAAAMESGRMSRKDAATLATVLVWDVENLAVAPKDAAAYASAKDAFLREVASGEGDDLDRAEVYAAARRYLDTLDSDGHTQLAAGQSVQAWMQSTKSTDAVRADVTRVIRVGGVNVLVLRPPAANYMDAPTMHDYAVNLNASIVNSMRGAQPCALVVDLAAQTGGSGWPPIALLGELVTPANRARTEDRSGKRTAVVSLASYAKYRSEVGPLQPNPLLRFRDTPVAVVMTPQTASAGEMVALMLSGEPTTRTFGQPSYGATTANIVLPLADGALVALTVARYAMDGQPVIRGKLQPDFPAEAGETPEQTLQRAAAWAAANSSLCQSH